MASGDFDADGFDDLVAYDGVGGLRVLYGASSGLTVERNQRIDRASPDVEGANQYDNFGTVLAVGHFNADAYADLAIGAPGRRGNPFDGSVPTGSVHVIYGSPRTAQSAGGLNATFVADQLWTQNSAYIGWANENYDFFGAALAAGDFDADGLDDLAVGSPGEDGQGEGTSDIGAVSILYGGRTRLGAATRAHLGILPSALTAAGNIFHLGEALTSGDFNGDEIADLAIGAPYSFIGSDRQNRIGTAHVVYGSRGSGIRTTGAQHLDWSSTGIASGTPEFRNHFGAALFAGNFNADRASELVLGLYATDTRGRQTGSGVVSVLPGSSTGVGRNVAARQAWTLDSPGVDPYVVREMDAFGSEVTTGDYNGDGLADLAISAPLKQDPSFTGTGTVTILFGARQSSGAVGLAGTGSLSFHKRLCSYAERTDDCLDRDGDGILAGVERLAGSSDASVDSDGDGIPDGIEINPEPVVTSNGFAANLRSAPNKPTVYVLLVHSPSVSGFQPSALAASLGSYFTTGSSKLDIKTWTKAIAAGNARAFHDGCDQTIASEQELTQRGWLTQAQVQGYLTSNSEEALIAPYAHLGRVCVQPMATPQLKGMIPYAGSWQFLVAMKSPVSTARSSSWHRALASLTAHELGHSLGLHHGGDSEDDCSPLYPSVMNHAYDFQPDAAGICAGIGFSAGLLEAAPPGKQLQLVAGSDQVQGTSEFDLLKDVVTSAGAPLAASQLGFLACFGKGDLEGPNDDEPASTISVAQCVVSGTDDEISDGPRPVYCANWDRDEFSDAEPNDEGGFGPVDGLYTARSLFLARSAGGVGHRLISGCTAFDLNPGGLQQPPLPSLPLKDSNDYQTMIEYLNITIRRTGCGTGDCAIPVREPPTATQVDALRDLWNP